jgi:putative endonuclease
MRATARQASPMPGFQYVYILESISEPGAFYVGRTENLGARLKKHNDGGVPHAAKRHVGMRLT